MVVLRKDQLEGKLGEEAQLIKSGVLRDENPLDETSEFNDFLMACRHGDLRTCQQHISRGVNINGKDRFDYTPLIIASLCGHYSLVELLLASDTGAIVKWRFLYDQSPTHIPGALAERNTFQGERCIYNALNDRIRNLLLQYDFSKSSDPYIYWSTHISTLLNRGSPKTSDITIDAGHVSFGLHKFLLSSRSPYFRKKLAAAPETTTWRMATSIPVEAAQVALRYLYLGEVPSDLTPQGSGVDEEEILKGLDKVSKQLEVEQLWDAIMVGTDRRLARQRHQDEVGRALKQVEDFFQKNVVGHRMVVDADRVSDVKWKHDNAIFADVLLRANEPVAEADEDLLSKANTTPSIPIGPAAASTAATQSRKAVLYPAHRAMLIRSEYFARMFSGDFLESQRAETLHAITIDCTPAVLEVILKFLYTENAACPLEHALDLLYAADMLFLDDLKSKAAQAISTLGSATNNALVDRTHSAAAEPDAEPINIYDVIHAAWELRVQRLEEFAARYLAYRLEDYIDDPDFADLIEESARRLKAREETDTIELLDDIRYYLSERFRLRFEDAGLEDMMDEEAEMDAELAEAMAEQAQVSLESEAKTTNGVRETNGTAADAVRTLDGEIAEDEFSSDAVNYQVLLGKIDAMLERLKLSA